MMGKELQISLMRKTLGENADLVDVEHEIDSTLGYPENLEAMRNKFPTMFPPMKIGMPEMIVEAMNLESLENSEREAIEKLKAVTCPDIDIFYKPMKSILQTTIKSDISSMFIIGKPGIGKSTAILKELGSSIMYKQGNISPLALYIMLYENQDKNIFFDDTNSLIRNKQAMSLLFQAMWSATGKRIVSWDTTSGRLKGYPKRFEFNGKIVFSMNEVPDNEDFRTLISRCFAYNLDFDYYTIVKIMTEISKLPHSKLTKEQREEIMEFIEENTNPATKDFNLRTQKKIEELYQYNTDWKELGKGLLASDEKTAAVLRLVKSGKKVREQVAEAKLNGISRATYFRTKKELGLKVSMEERL